MRLLFMWHCLVCGHRYVAAMLADQDSLTLPRSLFESHRKCGLVPGLPESVQHRGEFRVLVMNPADISGAP